MSAPDDAALVSQALRSCWGAVEQVRSYYVNWRMLRDVKRRQMAFEYADERLRLNSLRKNTILPKELQVHRGSLVYFMKLCEKTVCDILYWHASVKSNSVLIHLY